MLIHLLRKIVGKQGTRSLKSNSVKLGKQL